MKTKLSLFILSIFLLSQSLLFAEGFTIKKETLKKETGNFDIRQIYIPKLPEGQYSKNSIYVKFAKDIKSKNKLSLLSSMNLELAGLPLEAIEGISKSNKKVNTVLSTDSYGIKRIYKLSFSEAIDPYSLCKKLNENGDIEYAVPISYAEFRDFTPNDPKYANQWNLRHIGMPCAWEIAGDNNASEIVVGVIDSGVDMNHVDLKNNIWVNPNEIPNDGLDNDNNGYVDDVNGWDMVGNTTAEKAQQGIFEPDNNPSPGAGNSHGTNAAGMVSATTNNGYGIAGICQAKILPVKAALDGIEDGLVHQGYEGILYAAENGADIINISWGSYFYNPVHDDIIQAVINDYGVIVVAAASNDNIDAAIQDDFPMSYNSDIVYVSGYDSGEECPVAYGKPVDVFAPAISIYTVDPGGGHGYHSGTSFSTPQVSAALALIMSVFPDYTNEQVYHQMRSSVTEFEDIYDDMRYNYYGMLNVCNALTYNNPDIEDAKQVPGLALESIDFFSGAEGLSFIGENSMRLNIKNHLKETMDIKIFLDSDKENDKLFELKRETFFVHRFEEGEIDTLPRFNVSLKEANPWYHANCDVEIKYRSEDYSSENWYWSFENFNMPIRVQTDNSFFVVKDFTPSVYGIYTNWIAAHTPSNNYLYAAGYMNNNSAGIAMRYGGIGGDKVVEVPNTVVSAVFGQNISLGWFGTMGKKISGNHRAAEVFAINTPGEIINRQNVDDIVSSVFSICFHDEQNGIILGDQIQDLLSYGRTTNGGESWESYPINVILIEEEEVFWGACYSDSLISALGTKEGRIIIGRNDNTVWNDTIINENAKIQLIHFRDSLNAMCVYTEKDGLTNNNFLATSIDGGRTWFDTGINLYDLNISPVYLSSIDGTDRFTILTHQGSIYTSIDMGASWTPVLNWRYESMRTGFCYTQGDEVRMWQLGKDLSMLNFNINEVLEKSLYISTSSIYYGDVAIDTIVSKPLIIANDGDIPVALHSIALAEGKDAFSIEGELPDTLYSGEAVELTVYAQYSVEEKIRDVIILISDIGTDSISVYANFYKPVGITENLIEEINISPNPVEKMAKITIPNKYLPCEIEIYDLSGKLINSVDNFVDSEFLINFEYYSQGIYFIKVNSGNKAITKKIIVR